MTTNSESEEYREELLRLPDEELVRIAHATTDEFHAEAIAFAAEVLRSRGRDLNDSAFVRSALAEPTYQEQERQAAKRFSTDTAPTPAYPWPAWGLMAGGGAVFFIIWRGFSDRAPATNVYMTTLALLLFAASEYEVIRTWRQRSTLTKMRSLTPLIPASMLTAWSILLLLGVVHY